MQTSHLKNIIDDMLRNSLLILKDDDYQRKVWFRKEIANESFPTETIDNFLENSKIILNDRNSIQQIGGNSFSLLRQLHFIVQEYIDELEETADIDCIDEKTLLNDPMWQKIQTLSCELYDNLANYISGSSDGK